MASAAHRCAAEHRLRITDLHENDIGLVDECKTFEGN
jgi:hypothetical protein